VSYIVVAPLVVIRDARGQHISYAYQGATVENLIAEQAEHLLSVGFVRRVGDVEPTESIAAAGGSAFQTRPFEPHAEPEVPA
jgi:hypothetical protein